MEIINLTNRKIIIRIPCWNPIIIPPSEGGGELPSEPREGIIYIVPPEVKNTERYYDREDIFTPKGMTTTSDSCPRFVGCWYI